ncbi:PTS sugar transporter subunit IIB [Thermoanaerobacter wiegelii]|uniref:PTS sugar transporter subunit IIB n=1 Tax=Thermoanaerobacter wiegelii TaxID=46354 RepID=UPI001FCC46E6|nr:hypothetical protein [Thermoanaerobacter wiegelii]
MRIVLVCAAGLSTGLLVEAIKKAASKRGLDISVEAVGVERLETKINNADVVLLGPQIRFREEEIKK